MLNLERNLKVIFVDDDLTMLESTKRLFFDMDDWDMEFYESGFDVIKRVKEEFIDVVVSDMRMPEINGAELLDIIKGISPGTIRIILSGYSDKEMILQTVYSADQFIAKPCKPETLKSAITNTKLTIENVPEESLREIGNITRKLPTLPEIYVEIERNIRSDNYSIRKIAALIKKDIGISAKVIQIVNSAFFGHSVKINNIEMAVSHLGLETLQSLLLTENMFNTFTNKDVRDFGIMNLYEHSFLVSMLSKAIVKSITDDLQKINSCSIAGMLHDIGKLLLIKHKRDEYIKIFNLSKDGEHSLLVKEKEIFGYTHADIGSYLVTRWGLDKNICEAIRYHHNPHQSLCEDHPVTTAVYMANMLSYCEADDLENSDDFNKGYLNKLDLFKHLPEWKQISQNMKEILSRDKIL